MTKTASTAASAETVRLRLDSNPSRGTLLDGGWWPHSTNAAAELPALMDALAGRRGDVTAVMLHRDSWDLPHPRRMVAGGRRIRLGWFASQPVGLLTAICDTGRDRFDLLVVPPDTTPSSAKAAMTAAADGANKSHAPDLLTAAEHRD
jgi:hypothetical protein